MLLSAAVWFLATVGAAAPVALDAPDALGGPRIRALPETGLAQLQERTIATGRKFNLSEGLNLNEHGPFCYTQQLSHFEDGINGTFCQRYTVDKKFYKEGGPVILLVLGERGDIGSGSVEDPQYLEFEYHIAKEYNALVVTLEHRYYGYSQPVPELTTDNLRFLTIAEALEDTADFIRNFPVPDGLVSDPSVLKPCNTPWILYAGSYPGALVAWMRGKFPDLVWASIASSAVIGDAFTNGYLWATAPAKWGDPACIKPLEEAWTAIDYVFDKNDTSSTDELMDLFKSKGYDKWWFASAGDHVGMDWQGQGWEYLGPNFTSSWFNFCEKMKKVHDNITIGGESITGAVMSLRDALMSPYELNQTEQECKNYTNAADCAAAAGDMWSLQVPPQTEINMDDPVTRPWLFQSCRELGIANGGPPAGSKEPHVASKYWTPEGYDQRCRHWYPPGEHYQLPATLPEPYVQDEFGFLNYTYPRIAWIAGEWDPWYFAIKGKQESTPDNPFYMIPKGVHMWDKNTLRNLSDEPEEVQKVHRGLLVDVGRWLKEFKEQKHPGDNGEGSGKGNGHENGIGNGK